MIYIRGNSTLLDLKRTSGEPNHTIYPASSKSVLIHIIHPYHRNGTTVEYRQEPIPKSDYQRQLEDEAYESDDEHDKEQKGINIPIQTDRVIRYWSDFNRVYYVPRSIQQLPELPDWEAHKGNWNYGRETFERYASVSAFTSV